MSALSQAFDAVVALVKSEEEKIVLPQLATALQNIAANPTMINVVAQGNLLLTEVIADEMKIGQDALKQFAESVSNAAVAAVPPVAPAAK
jgi:hypothetical protein